MEPNKDFHHIIRRCQTLNAMNKRLLKLREDLSSIPADTRRRRYLSIQVAQEKLALQEHELHCEMVALGIADVNEDRYGNVTLTLQFGPTSLYFRKPGEPSQIIATGKDDGGDLSPLEMELEEVKRPEGVLDFGATEVVDADDEPGQTIRMDDDISDEAYEEDVWYGGDDIVELESIISRMKLRQEAGLVNKLASFEEKLKIAKAKAGIQEPKAVKGKKKVDAIQGLEATQVIVDEAVEQMKAEGPMKLSEATKIYKKTGEVPEGFHVISGNLYKKYGQEDPDRHVKAANDQAEDDTPPATPAKKTAAKKATTKEEKPKAEKAVKEEPQPLVKEDAGDIWSGDKKLGDDLIW